MEPQEYKLSYPYLDYWIPKSFLPEVFVTLSDGTMYEVFLSTADRIKFEIAEGQLHHYVESALIVINEISEPEIYAAIDFAVRNGFFERLKPF